MREDRGRCASIPVTTEFHSLHVAAEFQLNDTRTLQVVPNHHFVRGILWVLPATHDGKIVAAKEHVNAPNAAVREVYAEAESGAVQMCVRHRPTSSHFLLERL